MTYRRIGIIGAGNTGLALAAHLVAKGFAPLMFTRRTQMVSMLGKGLKVKGALHGNIPIQATTDVRQLVTSCDLLIISTWANAHGEVLRQIASSTEKSSCRSILILNGNWGAYQAGSLVKPRGIHFKIAESAGMPYVSRYALSKHDISLSISGIKDSITISQQRSPDLELDELLGQLFNDVHHEDSCFATSLSAPNPVIHAPLCLLNLARIQERDSFHILVDGFGPETESLIRGLDAERESLARCLHVSYLPILEQLNGFWNVHRPTLQDFFQSQTLYATLEGPRSLQHRFIQEDVPFGIVPLVDLGRAAGVSTPISTSLMELYRPYLQPYERIGFDAASLDAALAIRD
ncbi:MAG: NAD/NADP octopine/nopaline dehydrogenase family protein [Bifidobacterium aquikefiri]|uniref:NAD/NADP octopine/nopaline dehydrogenase n=1 Tax=Bifidobacterium aquikefiri TaxID=1653207 RepID=A0A261GB45_9BIFI|nr:NAD/NADP-dependent octopine/nopaline dehydrogenase family protein [Bifidobacterium aquikefiri]OZG68463.1 NAD/NADP octopine/nopaline dehydrogenase [Bifidobacterium aquikefiri]